MYTCSRPNLCKSSWVNQQVGLATQSVLGHPIFCVDTNTIQILSLYLQVNSKLSFTSHDTIAYIKSNKKYPIQAWYQKYTI